MDFTRRSFLQLIATAGGVTALAPFRLLRAEGKKVAIALEKAPKLKEVGGSMVLRIKEQNILLARDSETTVRAITPLCSHASCQVVYNHAQKRFDCPCHNSYFSLAGKVHQGPATKDIKSYPATLSGDRIILEL